MCFLMSLLSLSLFLSLSVCSYQSIFHQACFCALSVIAMSDCPEMSGHVELACGSPSSPFLSVCSRVFLCRSHTCCGA